MKRILKIVLATFVVVFCVNFCCTYVEAAVNSEYTNKVTTNKTVDSDSAESDAKSAGIGDTIMKYIGRFVFSIAKMIQTVVTTFTTWAFGVDVFPWEDYIVFNVLPYLDINFFNPAEGSIFMVGDDYDLSVGDMVRNVYFSLLTLALTIVSIGVLVTAIRLAVSSIAAEKAKYKEAIAKCLYTVVMLFSVHILIAFIFFLNESIVSACSQMLENLISDQLQAKLQAAIDAQDTSKNESFLAYNAYPYGAHVDFDNISLTTAKVVLWRSGDGFQSLIDGRYLARVGDASINLVNVIIGKEDYTTATTDILDAYQALNRYAYIKNEPAGEAIFGYLISKSGYRDSRAYQGYYVNSDGTFAQEGFEEGCCWFTICRILYDCEAILRSDTLDELKDYYNKAGSIKATKYFTSEFLKTYYEPKTAGIPTYLKDVMGSSYQEIDEADGDKDDHLDVDDMEWYGYVEDAFEKFKLNEEDNAVANVISELGNYFKDQTETYESNDINYVALIIYCILLIQSIGLLINYLKRVFYVTLLVLLAPVVVIYDFFMSAI